MNSPPHLTQGLKNVSDSYPCYLTEHSNLTCRRLHFVGSSLSLAGPTRLIATGKPQYLLYALLCGYSITEVGHYGFEKNKLASFNRPLHGCMSDWTMYKDI